MINYILGEGYIMTKQSFLGVVCACALSALASPALAVTIDYAATSGSQINLDPTNGCGSGIVGCFDFTPNNPGNNLVITTGSASGFVGSVDGIFGVGAISQLASVETATVNGTGNLTIFDGSTSLTATLNWVDIGSFGVGGIINLSGNVNLTSITYTGLDVDLLALASVGSGTQTATFQFTSPQSLTDLFETATSTTSTSFSGSISGIPVPAAIWLFGTGLLGLLATVRKKVSVG